MVESESLILTRKPDACVLRISLPMGISFNGHAGAIDWIQSRFKKSKPATLYYDEVRSPMYTDCLNPVARRRLAARILAGLYHAGGPLHLSLYQIAQIVNRVGGYDPDLLMGCFRHEAGPMPPRAGNVTMRSDKLARALGYDPFHSLAVALMRICQPTRHGIIAARRTNAGVPSFLASVLYNNPHREAAVGP